MKAEELRIGNYAMFNYKIQGFEQILICFNDFKNGLENNFELYQPIPLTEEWIIKLGFSYLADAQYWIDFKNMMFNWDKEVGLYLYIQTQEDSIDLTHIKHVHQLQNLYFALTGEELTIK